MVDHELVDAALQRVSLLAFLYYPEIHVDEPNYSLSDDVDFCMEPLNALDDTDLAELRQLTGRAIIDPSEYREEVFAALTALASPDPVEQG